MSVWKPKGPALPVPAAARTPRLFIRESWTHQDFLSPRTSLVFTLHGSSNSLDLPLDFEFWMDIPIGLLLGTYSTFESKLSRNPQVSTPGVEKPMFSNQRNLKMFPNRETSRCSRLDAFLPNRETSRCSQTISFVLERTCTSNSSLNYVQDEFCPRLFRPCHVQLDGSKTSLLYM